MKKFVKAIAALMLMTAVVCAAGCTKPDEPNNGGNNNGGNGGNSLNGHEYVDLGLPSGTLWATCNVGADTPEGYGDYFAWGETQPKGIYEWENYIYAEYVEGKMYYYPKFTKYCTNSSSGYNGFTDNLNTLLPEDDAATANWGSGWCMPTSSQWEELLGNTTCVWTMQNGVNGRRFTGSNGNVVFLPASSDCWGTESLPTHPKCLGEDGNYWSNSLSLEYDEEENDIASHFSFDSSSYQMDRIEGGLRFIGASVRPVCSSH